MQLVRLLEEQPVQTVGERLGKKREPRLPRALAPAVLVKFPQAGVILVARAKEPTRLKAASLLLLLLGWRLFCRLERLRHAGRKMSAWQWVSMILIEQHGNQT